MTGTCVCMRACMCLRVHVPDRRSAIDSCWLRPRAQEATSGGLNTTEEEVEEEEEEEEEEGSDSVAEECRESSARQGWPLAAEASGVERGPQLEAMRTLPAAERSTPSHGNRSAGLVSLLIPVCLWLCL